eukprot:7294598-Prymnesium_polylepis.1
MNTTSGCGARLWPCCSSRASMCGCLGLGNARVHRGAGPLRVALLRRDEHVSCPCPIPSACSDRGGVAARLARGCCVVGKTTHVWRPPVCPWQALLSLAGGGAAERCCRIPVYSGKRPVDFGRG